MNRIAFDTLLNTVCKHQVETGRYSISYQRLYRSLSEGPELSPAEIEKLWLSPAARRKFSHARTEVLKRAQRNWQSLNIGTPQQRLAASSKQEKYNIEYQRYQVILEKERDNWVISLILSQDLLAQIPTWAEVKLVDDQEDVWLQGCPNGASLLMAVWALDDDISKYVSRPVRLQLVSES